MIKDDAPGVGTAARSTLTPEYGWKLYEVIELDNKFRTVRNSKDPAGPVLTCTAGEWSAGRCCIVRLWAGFSRGGVVIRWHARVR
ncbi:MAG: DUF397 domain-containing protein [Actinomycetota bacterium]|nr:DUF397 domain-containing protein [Actinomycetota bacterium]